MRKIIIDTSPLIIHMVGVFNKNLVNKVSRYNSPDDEWTCVEKLLSQADDVFITPYVVGELFWLAKTRLNQDAKGIKSVFVKYKEVILRFKELYIEKKEILNFKNLEFGPTDISLFLAAKKFKYPILTSDNRFIGFCKAKKLKVIDFAEPLFNPHS
ncbi:MAG: hypothetical protein HZA07_07985 [Nitrospirae bacterium]|nr:hypothetical protein [Nitrospirota bacterium]